MKDQIFETILNTNKQYDEAVNNNASAEVQKNLLIQRDILFKTMIVDAGLLPEYKEYCEKNHR